jgi:O-acetylserine/cysteine efflux transporter
MIKRNRHIAKYYFVKHSIRQIQVEKSAEWPKLMGMNFRRDINVSDRRGAFAALVAAGMLWGLTVPLSKLALEWLDAGWLTVLRFGLAAPLLLLATRPAHLRAALTPRVALAGAIGFGLVIVLQNAGIARTNVSHASLIVGAVPVLVALIAVALRRGTGAPLGWAGHVLALAGVGLVAGAGGAGSSLAGDAIVLGSVILSATFIVAQPSLLRGRDPVAVTAVQLAAGALAALPYAVVAEGVPPAPVAEAPVLAAIGLAVAGTLLAFSLFAYGQSRVPADVAGAFVNLEPLVGSVAAAVAFHEPFGAIQLAGAAAILAGLALGSLRRPRKPPDGLPSPRGRVHDHGRGQRDSRLVLGRGSVRRRRGGHRPRTPAGR